MKTTLCRGLCTAMLVALPLSPAVADELSAAGYQKYFRSAAVLSAAAAAAAQVGACSQPLYIQEARPDTGGLIQLSFTCDGSEDEEATAIIEFREYDGGALIPERFLFAG